MSGSRRISNSVNTKKGPTRMSRTFSLLETCLSGRFCECKFGNRDIGDAELLVMRRCDSCIRRGRSNRSGMYTSIPDNGYTNMTVVEDNTFRRPNAEQGSSSQVGSAASRGRGVHPSVSGSSHPSLQ